MARLNDIQRATLASYWLDIQAAGYYGLSVTTMQAGINEIAQEAGRQLSFQENTALSTLYGYARRMFNAGESLRAAGINDVIDAPMISVPPWARDEQVMNTTPVYHVLYEFNFLDQEGVRQSQYRTSVFEMTLPETIGDLTSEITSDAEDLADKYHVTLMSVKLHEIHAV